MKIIRDDFLDAIDHVATPLMRATVAAGVRDAGAVLSADTAGAALVSAICPDRRFGPLGEKPLVGCELVFDNETTWLTPSQCAMHPGLSDWTPPSLAQAFMLPVEVAMTLAHVVGTAPIFQTAGVVTAEGMCSGQLVLTFTSGAKATVFYGQRFTGLHLVTTAYAIAGDGLFAIGEHLRQRAATDDAAMVQAERMERAPGVVLH